MSSEKASEKMDPEEDPKQFVREFIREEIEEELEEELGEKKRFEDERIRELVRETVEEERKELLKARRWENKKIKQMDLLSKGINIIIKIGFIGLVSYIVANYSWFLQTIGV